MNGLDTSCQDSINRIFESRLEWPQRLRYVAVAGLVLLIGVCGIGVLGVVNGLQQNDALMTAGSVTFSLMILIVSCIIVRLAGFRWVSLSPRISIGPTKYGIGVRIPTGRSTLVLVTLLASGAALGIVTATSWYLGLETLLPASRDNQAGANVMGIFGVIAFLFTIFLLTFRSPAVLQLTQSGVAHHVRRHRGLRIANVDDFAAWSSVTAITPETLIVNTGQSEEHNPQIRVTYRGSGSSHSDPAEEQDFLIQAHLMVAEPNTLYSLMKHMHEHPEDRHLLAEESAVQLLKPPPLRDRFRAAREVKKAEKAKKRAMRSKVRPYA